MLKSSTGSFSEGDCNDPETGFSPFPGNINQLLIATDPYVSILASTNGIVGEFVNPKYTDDTRTKFKKPARLECMMQDYPKLLGAGVKVGFSVVEKWLGYSPVKNNKEDALNQVKTDRPASSALTGECDMYNATNKQLQTIGCKLDCVPVINEVVSIIDVMS